MQQRLHEKAIMANNPRAVPGYEVIVLNPGPRGAADSPKKQIRLAYQTFSSPQKRVSYDKGQPFLLYGSGFDVGHRQA